MAEVLEPIRVNGFFWAYKAHVDVNGKVHVLGKGKNRCKTQIRRQFFHVGQLLGSYGMEAGNSASDDYGIFHGQFFTRTTQAYM